MERIVDKMRLLEYQRYFCDTKDPAFRPLLHRAFFSSPGSGGGGGGGGNSFFKFQYFCSLLEWLISMTGAVTAELASYNVTFTIVRYTNEHTYVYRKRL